MSALVHLWCCRQSSIADTSTQDLLALERAFARKNSEVEEMRRKRLAPRLEIVDGNHLYQRRKTPGRPEELLETESPTTTHSSATTASTRTSETFSAAEPHPPSEATAAPPRRSRLFRFLI
jgi:uncharacterized membrane protein